ncbi:MAG TPA: hypothetical protein VK002_12500 [Rubricoccaceae bacterium]|nr:hypothetical protein [Rubricoccaceae bacterium]
MSNAVAVAFGKALRQRGAREAMPAALDADGPAGSERRMAGGIGAKKVDVTWATEECGLILGASIKTINWRDERSGNFQKNLTNRRGDMLFESVTLHRRFPYAVLLGFLFLDIGAASDDTDSREPTFLNAHQRLKLFTGREDPGDREEQYERLYVVLVDANPAGSTVICTPVGQPDAPVSFDAVVADALALVADRNPDFYDVRDGRVVRR